MLHFGRYLLEMPRARCAGKIRLLLFLHENTPCLRHCYGLPVLERHTRRRVCALVGPLARATIRLLWCSPRLCWVLSRVHHEPSRCMGEGRGRGIEPIPAEAEETGSGYDFRRRLASNSIEFMDHVREAQEVTNLFFITRGWKSSEHAARVRTELG